MTDVQPIDEEQQKQCVMNIGSKITRSASWFQIRNWNNNNSNNKKKQKYKNTYKNSSRTLFKKKKPGRLFCIIVWTMTNGVTIACATFHGNFFFFLFCLLVLCLSLILIFFLEWRAPLSDDTYRDWGLRFVSFPFLSFFFFLLEHVTVKRRQTKKSRHVVICSVSHLPWNGSKKETHAKINKTHKVKWTWPFSPKMVI